jgi:hypothetical protein
MSLNQYRELREISLATWAPANDVDWIGLLTNPTPANIPQLEFDEQQLQSDYGVAFYVDMVLANGTRLAWTDQTVDVQLIVIGNPTDPNITTASTVQNVAVGACQLTAVDLYKEKVFPNVGPGIYGLRFTGWAGSDPGAAAGAFARVFMRGI